MERGRCEGKTKLTGVESQNNTHTHIHTNLFSDPSGGHTCADVWGVPKVLNFGGRYMSCVVPVTVGKVGGWSNGPPSGNSPYNYREQSKPRHRDLEAPEGVRRRAFDFQDRFGFTFGAPTQQTTNRDIQFLPRIIIHRPKTKENRQNWHSTQGRKKIIPFHCAQMARG